MADEPKDALDELEDALAALEQPEEAEAESAPRVNALTGDPSAEQRLVPKAGDRIASSYEVQSVIDTSSTSAVLAVRHLGVDRTFVMKLLFRSRELDEEATQRFREEAKATSMIGHENIVFTTDFGHSSRFGHFYVMEYLDGSTLAASVADSGPQSVDRTLQVAINIGGALAAAHDLGVVHRNVRPEKIMFHRGRRAEEVWKLLDFGISTAVVDAGRALGLYRSPVHVAPEIARGDEATKAADQYGLASVLYYTLGGRAPWPEKSWTSAADLTDRPEALSQLRDDVGPFLDEVLERALHDDPAARFPSVDAFVAAFQRASGRTRRPTLSPIDSHDATRSSVLGTPSASVIFGTSFDGLESTSSEDIGPEPGPGDFSDPPSVEVSLDTLPNLRTKVTMDFQTVARLRREWRRNLVAGGLFVPTTRTLDAGTPIVVGIRFAPTGQEASFPAKVTSFTASTDDDPGGLSIEIEPALLDALQAFLSDLDLGTLDSNVVVHPRRQVTMDARLTADEAFVMSRLSGPTTVANLRAWFNALPFDLDGVLGALAEGEWVDLAGARNRTRSASGDESRETFVQQTLERAEYHLSQGNFLAQLETLRRGAERYRDEAEFHFQIAMTLIQFQNDLHGAYKSLSRAVGFAPGEPRYRAALDEVEKLRGHH